MKSLPLNHNIQMEGTVSQIIDIDPRFSFTIKNGNFLIIFCVTFKMIYYSFDKMRTKA